MAKVVFFTAAASRVRCCGHCHRAAASTVWSCRAWEGDLPNIVILLREWINLWARQVLTQREQLGAPQGRSPLCPVRYFLSPYFNYTMAPTAENPQEFLQNHTPPAISRVSKASNQID